MPYLCVNKDGTEYIHELKPNRGSTIWSPVLFGEDIICDMIKLPKGTIRKILGYELTWNNGPVEIKDV